MPKLKNNQNGVALILSIMLMTVMFFLSVYYLNSSLSEKQISHSQSMGEKTYYLAESGVADVIWKLKNDASFRDSFETDPAWTADFTRTDPFGPGSGSYSVNIANTSLAHGDITSVGIVEINGKRSQRIIKTKVYKPIGQSGIGDNSSFSDGNIDFSSANINYIGVNAHSNGNFIINGQSNINLEYDLETVGNYNINWQSSISLGGEIHASNFPPEAETVTMPAVDFDSTSAASLKNRAASSYSPDQFEDLLNENPSPTLNGIIYINGNTEIEEDTDLTINGLLVVNGNLDIGVQGNNNGGGINLTINSATGTPSGIMAKGKIKFMNTLGNMNISGVLYSTDQVTLENLNEGPDFIINGGTASRKLTITSSPRIIDIIYNNQILVDSLGPASSSPVLIVEHWEEEY